MTPRTTGEACLALDEVSKRFGSLAAVNRLTFSVRRASITSLIGPNGAGKSTVFNLITGYTRPSGGSIRYEGQSLVGMQPHRVNQRGIARAFQISRPFAGLSVRENVKVAALFGRHGTRDVDAVIDDAMTACRLTAHADRLASELTVGELRKLELARAFATRPSLLLADEPLAGLVPAESLDVVEALRDVRGRGVTVLLIEHDMKSVMSVSDHVIVLEAGQKIAEGDPATVTQDQRVIEAYLGVEEL